MKTAILTDSTAYLTPEQIAAYDITVVSIPLIWEDETYYDNKNISVDEFYTRLKTAENLPTTSTPSMGEMQANFDRLAEEGYDNVICILLSSGISSFVTNLAVYAKSVENINVYAYDSKITCAGLADMALLAGKLAEANKTPEEIIEALDVEKSTMGVYFMVDDLSHLKRTGRLSNASSFIGGLLKIKPILSMDIQAEGKISAIAKERQAKRAYEHIKNSFGQAIANADYPIRLTVFDAADKETQQAWVDDLQASFPQITVDKSIIGPVIGVHVGQGTMAMIWARDWKSFD
ncbi:DegV family protein [Agrilactobacillus yilanensis]|uniref:DegV family protein n=1 Tax=Agrilactobacillus yilanensis TaxID=2485997 RepID=A0ABW4J9V6_9LACO|nr:DegV family protein [Agrilactobacillus yilanensis]